MTAKKAFDDTQWMKALDNIADPELRESLARKTAVEIGVVLRDEAKRRAPVGQGGSELGRVHGKSSVEKPGELRDAMYLAFKAKRSNEARVIYSVNWNHRQAGHGHLAEFGHDFPYSIRRAANGYWFTDKTRPNNNPIRAKGALFMQGTWESKGEQAIDAGMQRLRNLMPEYLAQVKAK